MKKKKLLWQKRVDEFFTKGIIDQDQKTALTKMIDSPDDENFTIVEEVLKLSIKEKLSEGLNGGQKEAFCKIIEFLEGPKKDALVLKGYAGTGKTFLVKRIIEYITQTDHKIKVAIGAPTNKAVQQLYRNSPSNSVSLNAYMLEDIFDANSRLVYSTIHKLLGMKEVITDLGEQLFKADSYADSNLSDYNVLVVDEISMLDDKLCDSIMDFSDKLHVIFMGDSAQIPPIKKLNCIPFSKTSKYNFNVIELTEIMRQSSDNPIIKLSFEVRNNLDKDQAVPVITTDINSKGHGVIHFESTTDKDKIKPLLNTYFNTKEFIEDSDYMKVIAWRNKTTNYVNGIVRELLYGVNPDRFLVGEKLIVNKPIFYRDEVRAKHKTYINYKILFTTSEELEVKEVDIFQGLKQEGGFAMNVKYYNLLVTCYNPMKEGLTTKTIEIIHEDSIEEYKMLMNRVKEVALRFHNWVSYFNIQKWNADVTYNYAISAHKSQGSTYTNVLVLEDDLDANWNIVERNRIKYTAVSRAKEKLFILRKNLITV